MTRRQDLEHHRQSLAEIRNIMNSMKTLAYMETRKLARFLDAQHAVVGSIEDAAADFLSFHQEILPEADKMIPVYLLIGTERGFCGDFNQALIRHLDTTLETQASTRPILIVVGRKLQTLLEDDERVSISIEGAGTAEEVTAMLDQIVKKLVGLQQEHGSIALYVLHHGNEDGIIMKKLLPPFQHYLHKAPEFSHPPILNLSPSEFLIELTDHYLFSALHEILYTSLTVENYHRMTHLEGAIKRLDDESEELCRQSNALRQEEIIEEIEVILLSAASLDEAWRKRK
jgi:F-type H+-transporting ATPase subunit gamma